MSEMAILSKHADWQTWSDDFFPPLKGRVLLRVVLGAFLILAAWAACSTGVALGMLRNGCPPAGAATVGALLPVFLLIVLNALGVFNRRRPAPRSLVAFGRWLASPAAQREGLDAAHLTRQSVTADNQLHLVVSPSWLAQSPQKRLADVGHWRTLWDFCLNAFSSSQPVLLVVKDHHGRVVGGSSPGEGTLVWLEA